MPRQIKSVGVIGLGIMGTPIATHLLGAKFSVPVWTRTRAKVDEIARQGASPCSTPAEVGEKSQAVIVSLTTPQVVKKILLGTRGLAEGLAKDSIIIDASTIGPEAAQEMAASLARQKIHYLDAPVSGGPVGALTGTLSIMAGGDKGAFDRCKPIFQAIGREAFHVGPVGAGQYTKLVNQVLVALNAIAGAEALALAKTYGLDLGKVIDVVKVSSGDSHVFRSIARGIKNGVFEQGQSGLSANMNYIMQKDLELAMRTNRSAKQPVKLLMSPFAHRLYVKANRLGLGAMEPESYRKLVSE